MDKKDIEFCYDFLPKVSRTFALSISQLKEPLKSEVCIAYLICRILDTIEDSPTLSFERKKKAISIFLDLLKGKKNDNNIFNELFGELKEKSSFDDASLVMYGETIKRSFLSIRKESQKAIYPWVKEMGRGMILYCKKMEDADGRKQIKTISDLDDYCYYIAGTVGFMLTNLFYINCEGIDKNLYSFLQERTNDFGLALQKINILKDIRDDYLRGWCFIPLKLLTKNNLSLEALTDEEKGEKVFMALSPLLKSLEINMKKAFEYILAIPEKEKEIRLFLSTSLFFAAATLDLIFKNKGALLSPKKLKISRLQVSKILFSLQTKCNSNTKLQNMWQKFTIRQEI